MKNRRILTHPELEPNQIRAVDAFSKFNSDIVNNLTKIVHKVDQPDIVIDGLDVIENCSDNVEYLSQELINYQKFEGYNHCHLVDNDLQIYVSDDDLDGVKDGYIIQNLSDNQVLDLTRFYGSNVTKTFVVSFTLTNGTPKNLFLKIGESVLDLKYLDGAYAEEQDDGSLLNKPVKYTVSLDVNFKNVTKNLILKLGAYIDKSDYRNFYSRDDQLGVSFLTISDISCKMLIRDKSKDTPFYSDSSDWDINNTHYVTNLRINEGTAVKDNVVLTCLKSVNLGNSSVVLPVDNPKSWIHNNPYTAHEFYNSRSEIFDIRMIIDPGNRNLEFLSATIDDNQNLVANVRNNQTKEIKQLPLTDYNNISDNYLTFRKINEDDYYATFETNSKYIGRDFCSNTLIVTSKGKVVTKIDTVITNEWCNQVTFKVLKKDFDSVDDIKVCLSNAYVKVAKESKHVLWGYVVCYYSYYKNPNPNACYLGLIREEDYLKDGYTEDYLTLAKVRFVDPHTIDLIQYLDNRNNYEIPNSRDINYIVTFNYPDIWYTKNPVTVTDAINYCEVLRVNVLRRYKLKHDKNAPLDTAFRLLNTDGRIDKKGRISVDLQDDNINSLYHLQRRIAPNTRLVKITNIYETDLDLDPTTPFNWDILRSKWITPDEKWAISDDFSRFGLFDKYANDISDIYIGFNNYSPFKFMNPRTGRTAIELDWDFSTLRNCYIPQNDLDNDDITKFDLAKNDTYLLSYYPSIHRSGDASYIKNLKDEVSNSWHNHFSYIQFRNQLLSRNYMMKMLDMLPVYNAITKQYLIDGRILTSIDGHITSSIHQLSYDFDDNTLINAEIIEPGVHDKIQSTSYIISTNNFKTRGNSVRSDIPKLLQDNQILIYASEKDKKTIQSSNYVIDNLNLGFLLISETDEKGIIHIKSASTRYSKTGDLLNHHTVIGKVYPEYQEIDTDRYYLSTYNGRTKGDKDKASDPKFFQDQQLLIASVESNNETSIESSNVIIDERLISNHIIIDESDDDNVIHLKSSKNQISNSLIDGNLITANDVSDVNATIDSCKYDISTTNRGTKGDTDKPLQNGHILTVGQKNSSTRSIESSNIVIDVVDDTDSDGHYFVKISEKDADGVIHIKNSNKVINELQYDLCYLPGNIKIKDGKVHITIDCLKKFRITSSQILASIQNDPNYMSIFNYDLDKDHPQLFTVVLHYDIQDAVDTLDRDVSSDKSFKVTANTYESEILFINDIGLSQIRRHVVTEQERNHVVMEEDHDKHLVLENDEASRFRSCVGFEYIVTKGSEVLTTKIEWVDELRGYNNQINENSFDPDRPHKSGEAEDVDYVFSSTEIEVDSDEEMQSESFDDTDDVSNDVETKTSDIDMHDQITDVTVPKNLYIEDIEEVGDVEDVDKIEFKASEVDGKTGAEIIDKEEFETVSIDKSEFDAEDTTSSSEATDVNISGTKVEEGGREVSLFRPHDADNISLDLSSFLNLFPCVISNQYFARKLRTDDGYSDARGPLECVFAQSKARIMFNLVKNNTQEIENLIPGLTFSTIQDKTVYAYSETYVLK